MSYRHNFLVFACFAICVPLLFSSNFHIFSNNRSRMTRFNANNSNISCLTEYSENLQSKLHYAVEKRKVDSADSNWQKL